MNLLIPAGIKVEPCKQKGRLKHMGRIYCCQSVTNYDKVQSLESTVLTIETVLFSITLFFSYAILVSLQKLVTASYTVTFVGQPNLVITRSNVTQCYTQCSIRLDRIRSYFALTRGTRPRPRRRTLVSVEIIGVVGNLGITAPSCNLFL